MIDPSQAAVAGATVPAANRDTSFARDTRTNSAGGYALPTLPPGTYTIKVVAPGFQTCTQTGVIVAINSVTRVDVALAVGQVSESLTVAAQAGALQTDRADVRTDMTAQSLTACPCRSAATTRCFFPPWRRALPRRLSGGSFAANPSRAVQVVFNGVSRWGNNTRIDGASSTDFNGTYPMYTPALESIETVNVVTNSFDAEQGLASAAAVNIQTRTRVKRHPWFALRGPHRPASQGVRLGRRSHTAPTEVHPEPVRRLRRRGSDCRR